MNLSDKIYYYLKRSVQILLPISIFSLLVLIPPSYSSLHHSYNQFLSKFLSKNMVEKNCMFLVFNGILVLIIRASGLIGHIAEPVGPTKGLVQDHRPGSDEEDKARFISKKVEDDVMGRLEEEEDDDDEEEEEVNDDINVEEENGRELYKEEEEEEDEEGIDELNKKCDNFIKKVRQEIYGL